MSKRDVEVADTLPPEDEDEDEGKSGEDESEAEGESEGKNDGKAEGKAERKRSYNSEEETAPELMRRAQPSADAPPVTGWDRYELLDLLGKGGMGVVYRARDRRLGRLLAIKFIQGADPSLTLRLMREAHAQARMEHPNVCRVYEVGEIQGRAYIALQFIDGEPLNKAAARMSLDEKIAVMRDVALAVHEAHRLGIVHRDLKPGNVLVERTEDARWVPVVMDFGLARETAIDVRLTESGMPLGTPAYMSPEQARGDTHVDRRSDIYSLGATLYELLTGNLLFPDTPYPVMMVKVLYDEPAAPRSVVPSLPIDLETITLKCLAKDPVQRYASARALADDLGRYLDGEPILGRRSSLWQRLRRRAKRNRALVILGASSLAVIVVVAALGIRAWLRSEARARLTEQLARQANEIDSRLREAYLLPLHDTRPDLDEIRTRMTAIKETQHHLGQLGEGIVHNALGRGHLALREWREAADELQRAADHGFESPEMHAAHARALGELYRLELEGVYDEARRSRDRPDKDWLARRQRELAQQYLEPAHRELDRSQLSGLDAQLLEARKALYERDFAVALARAQAIAKGKRGSAEARRLAADAAYGAGVEAFDRGAYDAARAALEKAAELYADASEITRSDPSLYEAAVQTWLQRAEIAYRQGLASQVAVAVDRAIEIIDQRALVADPDDVRAYTSKVSALLLLFRSPQSEGDEQPLLDRIAEAAKRAVEVGPKDPNTWTALGTALVYRAFAKGLPELDRAVDAFGKALAIDPTFRAAHNGLGTAHRWRGDSLARTGLDPMPEYRAALASYERASASDAQHLPSCANQVELHGTFAEHDDALGLDPRPALASALRVGERCMAINDKFHLLLNSLTRAHLVLASYLVETGGDPREAVQTARGYLASSESVHPGSVDPPYYRAIAARVEMRLALRDGADPGIWNAVARAELDAAWGLSLSDWLYHLEAARFDLLEAARPASGAAAALLAHARAEADLAIALDDKPNAGSIAAAEACLAMARAFPSPALIELARDYLDQVLARNPQHLRARLLEAELAGLGAP